MTLDEAEMSHFPSTSSSASFWHSQPSKILTGHRTTQDLPTTSDYVIIGSGISGAFAAHWLKENAPDANVVMLDAREACWGATGRVGS
jgi:ribulose 1,5-bisphosphate synthetase/thiazole synthase